MNINLGGVATVIFVALLAGSILYWGGGALSDFPFADSEAGVVRSFGVVLLVIGLVTVLLLATAAVIKAYDK